MRFGGILGVMDVQIGLPVDATIASATRRFVNSTPFSVRGTDEGRSL